MGAFNSRTLGRLPGAALSVIGYRNQAKGFDPRSGDGVRRFGGRFNPPHSYPVLYLCLSRRCVVAELTRQADRQSVGVEDLLPRELWQVATLLNKVLDLTNAATLEALDLGMADVIRDDHGLTQEVGEGAHEHGFQAIRSPSATGIDDVLAIFPENLAGAVLAVELIAEWVTSADIL